MPAPILDPHPAFPSLKKVMEPIAEKIGPLRIFGYLTKMSGAEFEKIAAPGRLIAEGYGCSPEYRIRFEVRLTSGLGPLKVAFSRNYNSGIRRSPLPLPSPLG